MFWILNFDGSKNMPKDTNFKYTVNEGLHVDLLLIFNGKVNTETNFEFVVQKNSSLSCFSLFKLGEEHKNTLHVELLENAKIYVGALLLNDKTQKQAFSCTITHKEDSASSEVYVKDVLRDSSVCKVEMLTNINKGTKNSKVLQANHALVLSEDAHIFASPHLQIYSDDLSASHGCTVGDLDAESISYLMSRGIDEQESKQILIKAFVDDSLSALSEETKEEVIKVLGEDYV